ERRRVVNAELQKVLQMRTRLTQLNIDEKKLGDFEEPVAAALTFEAPNYFTGESELLGEFSDGKIWSKLVSLEWDNDRQTALDLGAPFEVQHRLVIEAPPAYRLSNVPKEKQIRSKWGAFSIRAPSARATGQRRITLEFRLRLEKDRVEAADFEA